MANNKRPKAAKPVQPNTGTQQEYSSALTGSSGSMADEYEAWFRRQWESFPKMHEKLNRPAPFDTAVTTFAEINRAVMAIGRRWVDKMEHWAPLISKNIADKVFKQGDASIKRMLVQSGFQIDFQVTPVMREAFESVVSENVALIKSIPTKYHAQVEEIVRKAYLRSADVGEISRELQTLKLVTANRADFIARDQVRKANSVVNRARAMDLGITQAVWRHSHAGREPRIDHMKADGQIYNLAEGCFISGEYIHPGELPNCRCLASLIMPFQEVKND